MAAHDACPNAAASSRTFACPKPAPRLPAFACICLLQTHPQPLEALCARAPVFSRQPPAHLCILKYPLPPDILEARHPACCPQNAQYSRLFSPLPQTHPAAHVLRGILEAMKGVCLSFCPRTHQGAFGSLLFSCTLQAPQAAPAAHPASFLLHHPLPPLFHALSPHAQNIVFPLFLPFQLPAPAGCP